MGLLQTITNALGGRKETNSYSPNHFLKYGGSRGPVLAPTWSGVKLDTRDAYRGYPYAAIQRKGNRVASLAKKNLFVDVSPDLLKAYQRAGKDPRHPYLALVEDSTTFSTKKFWKTTSIYLDLTGRFYLGVVRDKMPNGQLSNIKEFILLNPLEIRRVINSRGEVAGFTEHKADGRQRSWPAHQIMTFIEESPFDNSQAWSMVDAAKPAIYTLNQSGDHTRQSINGNLNAPGIITTDIILDDGDFDNFRSRIVNGVKGEPIFGNGSGAIQWQDMQVDLNKAALLDVNEINRAEFIAVAGTSKTNLGIEESGTTRETARVQDDNFLRDTIEPRVEDIIDVLNLDYRVSYASEFARTGYRIELRSGASKDYESELKATELRMSQAELAQGMYEKGYTWDSSVSYATGAASLEDLVLDKKRIAEAKPVTESDESEPKEPEDTETSSKSQEKNEAQPQPINITVQTPEREVITPQIIQAEPRESKIIIQESDKQPVIKVSPVINVDANSKERKPSEEIDGPEDQGWVGAKVPAIDVTGRLEEYSMDTSVLTDATLLGKETTNIPGEQNPHVTLVYGLVDDPMKIQKQVHGIVEDSGLKAVTIKEISHFDVETGYAVVAELNVSPEIKKTHESLLALGHYRQKHAEFRPHITLFYMDSVDSAGQFTQPQEYYAAFEDLVGQELDILGLDLGDEGFVKNTYKNDITPDELMQIENAHAKLQQDISNVHQSIIDAAVDHVTINSFSESDIITSEEKETFLNQLQEFIKHYWLLVVPIFGGVFLDIHKSLMRKHGDEVPYSISDDLRWFIIDNADKTAHSHLDTVINDVLKASNKAYNDVLNDVAVKLIGEAYDRNPDKFADYFSKKPTKKQIQKAIDSTDILENNRKIYDKANKLALEGHDRAHIVNTIREEYAHLTKQRATTIARHETSRAYVQAQYDADKALLEATGQINNAYKQLYSRSGHPCEYCQALIDRGPVPFEQNFLNKGGSLEIEKNGKTHTFTADYEDINAGSIHVNCNCSYKLVIKNGEVANAYTPEMGDNINKVANNLMNTGECTDDCCEQQ